MKYSEALTMAEKLGLVVEANLLEDDEAHGRCVHWTNTVEIKPSLPEALRTHVLLHEICHATGTEERLNRNTLIKYDSQEVYALVEECIVETATLVILETYGMRGDRGPLMQLMGAAELDGIEPEEDINPEVTRILTYLLGA